MSGRRATVGALVAFSSLLPASVGSQAKAVLREADVRIVMTTPTSCDVTEALTIETPGPATIEHRLQIQDGARADLLAIGGGGANPLAPPEVRTVGRTRAFDVPLAAAGRHAYTIRYRVTQGEAWKYRCPIWLPTTPTDGLSRAIRLMAELPASAAPASGEFPALAWTTPHQGAATLGHLPAFVSLPFFAPGENPSWLDRWDIATVTDILAVVALVIGTVVWVRRRRR